MKRNRLHEGRNWMQIRQDDDLRGSFGGNNHILHEWAIGRGMKFSPPRTSFQGKTYGPDIGGLKSGAIDGRDTRRGEIPRGIAKLQRAGGNLGASCVADASASPLVREGIATPWRLAIVDRIHAAKLCIQGLSS